MQNSLFTTKQRHNREADGVGTTGRSSRKHSVRSVVERRGADQIEALGSMKLPNYEQMRETLDVSEPYLELRQDPELTPCLVFGMRTFGNFRCNLVRAADKTNR